MRLLLTIHHKLDRHSGAPGVTLAQAETMRRLDVETDVFSYDDLPGGWAGRVGLLLFPWVLAWHVLLGRGRGKYDWIDASTGDGWVLALLPRAWRPGLAMTSHGIEHLVHRQLMEDRRAGMLRVGWKYWLFRGSIHLGLIRFTARRSDAVWCLNREEQRLVVEEIGVPAARCRLIANGLDEQLPAVNEVESLRPAEGAMHVAFIGSYIDRKGVRNLEQIADRYLRDHPDATLRLLGTGLGAEEVLGRFAEDVRDRVRVTPRFERPALPELLEGASVILLTSLCEGYGVAVLDGMACGLAPVVSEACGIADHLEHGVEVLTFPTHDPAAAADLLGDLAADRARLTGLRRAAVAAVPRFSWERIVREKLAVYTAEDSALEGSAPAGTMATAELRTMRISVLIPTYRRADDLRRGLDALAAQRRPADQVVVVARPDDTETQRVIAEWNNRLPVTNVAVDRPGVVAAMNAGWAEAEADVVALTDDDSAPHADWLERIESAFAESPTLGAFGGRDLIGGELRPPGTRRVGELTWYGKMVGGHHLGTGPARSVDFLKGVNMAVRRCAAPHPPFDEALRGGGAQVHWEIDLCLGLAAAGWSLVYDPALRVDHHPAPRFDADQRVTFNFEAEVDRVHNETMVLRRHLPRLRRWAYAGYMGLIGTRENVGLVQALHLRLAGDPNASQRWAAGRMGRAAGRAGSPPSDRVDHVEQTGLASEPGLRPLGVEAT
ncbi:MAG: glycosyltransferase [Planctomycetota bacterium]